MLSPIDQPSSALAPDAAIATLLRLLHDSATTPHGNTSPRAGYRIRGHLMAMARRDDVPEILHQTCAELAEAWGAQLDLALGKRGRP